MNEFEQSLVECLTKKDLSQSSIRTYISNLRKINDNQHLTNLTFLKSKSAIEIINNKTPVTKRNYLASVVSVLDCFKNEKGYKALHTKYQNLLEDAVIDFEKNKDESKLQKNILEWNKVEEIRNSLKNDILTFIRSKNLTESQYNKLLSYTIICLLTMLPPRRNLDYQLMHLTNKLNNPVDKNWYDYKNHKFIFNVFKTSKTEGQIVIDIPADLVEVLNLYLKHHPLLKGLAKTKWFDIPLLVFSDGKQLKHVNSITRILNKVFKGNVGSSILRHSYLTSKYGDIKKEQATDAKLMSHSVNTQREYIIDKSDKKTE